MGMTTKTNPLTVSCPGCGAIRGTECRGKRTHKERRAEAERLVQRALAHDAEMTLHRKGAPGVPPSIAAEDLAAVQEYARERGPHWRLDMAADWLFVRRPVWGRLIGLRARGNAWLWQSDFGV